MKLILGLAVSCLLCIAYSMAEDNDYRARCEALGGVASQDADHHNVCLRLHPKKGLQA